MLLHKIKKCPRRDHSFQCKLGDISHCDCTSVSFTLEEKAFIETRYDDCLCLNCLNDLKNKFVLFKEKYFGG